MSWLKIRAFALLFCASFIIQLVHLLQFLVVFGTGIVFQVIFYYIQYNFYDTKSPFGLECFVTLITMALGAAITVENSKKIFSSVNFVAIKHPILFFTIPNTVCTLLFVLSFACITRLFFTLPDVDHYILHNNWNTGGAYLLCVSYIIYVTVTVCYKDRNFIRDRISGHACCQFVAFAVAVLLQAATIFVIIKPIMEAVKDYLIHLKIQAAYTLGYVLLFGLLMGIAAGILEKYAHCVVHKRRAPFYWYENSVESRTCLLQFLAFPIHYGFCKPKKSLPMEASSDHFYIFTIYSSLALMQFSKILYMIIFDHKNLDVVCGYSNRTAGRERRLNRNRSRSPRTPSSRLPAGQEENNQHSKGATEEQEDTNTDTNNNQIRQNNRRMKLTINTEGKTEKSGEEGTGFLSFLLPVELPIIFATEVVLKAVTVFLYYVENQFEKVFPAQNSEKDAPSIALENLPETTADLILITHIEGERKSKTSVVNIEIETDGIILDTNENLNGNGNICQETSDFPKIFSEIHDHVSGDNVHAMANKPSAQLTTVAETKDIY